MPKAQLARPKVVPRQSPLRARGRTSTGSSGPRSVTTAGPSSPSCATSRFCATRFRSFGRFLTAQWNEELAVKDVLWINADGSEISEEQWHDPRMHCFGMLLDGRGQETGIKRQAGDASLLLIMNSCHDVVQFKLPDLVGGSRWLCMLDTNQPERSETPAFDVGQIYDVTGRSFLLFAGLTAGGPGRAVRRIALELTALARATRWTSWAFSGGCDPACLPKLTPTGRVSRWRSGGIGLCEASSFSSRSSPAARLPDGIPDTACETTQRADPQRFRRRHT